MSENGFCPCGNFGVLGEDCPLCGKPFASGANTIAPESAERSADVLGGHKDADIEEFVAKYNPKLRLAEAFKETEPFREDDEDNALAKLSLPEVGQLLSLFSEEQLELLTVCEPWHLGYILIHASDYLEPGDDIKDDIGGRWEYLLVSHARENGYEGRADIVEITSNTPEPRDGRWIKSGGLSMTKKGNCLLSAMLIVLILVVSIVLTLCGNDRWRYQFANEVSPITTEVGNDLDKLKKTNVCVECDLSGANLGGADLGGADLAGANLTGATLTGADLTGATLTLAKLSRANLTGANLAGANLTDANLSGADLAGANLTGATLTGADLTGANLTGAGLEEANLTGAGLEEANLTGANLAGANLSGADLANANLYEADLEGANLDGVFSADFTGALNVPAKYLKD